MTYKEINRYLWRYGYAFAPTVLAIEDLTEGHDGPIKSDGTEVEPSEDFLSLQENDPARIEMLRLAQEWRKEEYQEAALEAYGRGAMVDGKPGPATYAMIEAPRCGCPDYAPPRADVEEEGGPIGAIGTGPWKGCHGIGNFHAKHIRFTNAPPAHLTQNYSEGRTVFQEILHRYRAAERKIGLMLYFSGPGTGDQFLPPEGASVQSNYSWVGSMGGPIGLAIVGNNSMSCSSAAIWARFLQTYGRNFSIEDLILFILLLLMHEGGHNKGLGHTSGGIMNPSLHRTKPDWFGDVAQSWMVGRFGGIEVPLPGPGPGPDDPDVPTWAKWLLNIVTWLIKNWPKKVKA